MTLERIRLVGEFWGHHEGVEGIAYIDPEGDASLTDADSDPIFRVVSDDKFTSYAWKQGSDRDYREDQHYEIINEQKEETVKIPEGRLPTVSEEVPVNDNGHKHRVIITVETHAELADVLAALSGHGFDLDGTPDISIVHL